MNGLRGWMGASVVAATMLGSGCGFQRPQTRTDDCEPTYYADASTRIEYPDVATCPNDQLLATRAPLTVLDEEDIEFSYLTLQEAVRTALSNSRVLRDLGGVVLRSPSTATSTYDVALQELDPRFGVAAALSEFDASFATSAFFERNDRALNNQFFGGGTRLLRQQYSSWQSQISKRAATGTEFAVRQNLEYDANNAPGNQFESIFNVNYEVEMRHPLLRGGGTDFNRIGGPSGSPGSLNGVVLARINTDISLAQFEMAVRDFVSNVENAYWDLYFAFRDLDNKIVARNAALQTWNSVNALYQAGRVGGEAEKEAQAREQYYRFQDQVQNALSGRLVDSTATNNGSAGGSFRANGGVLTAERRLRLVMGLPITDGTLLRPQDEPIEARVIFEWESILCESLERRPELRRQKWLIKRREQELIASANFLLPELDVVGRYRWRGFGDDLLPHENDEGRFNNAYEDLLSNKFDEWQLGVEFTYPFGRRRAHAANEYSEMQLARERIILAEQEREVVHQVSNAVAEMNRSYAVLETSDDRRLAAAEQLEAVQAAYESDKASLDLLLRTQQSLLDAERDYYRAVVEYTLAIRNVHYEKGSLLDYNEVYLTEDVWPLQAYEDAAAREKNKVPSEWLDGMIVRPAPLSEGEYEQNIPGPNDPRWQGRMLQPMPDAGSGTGSERVNPPGPTAPQRPAPYDEPAPGSEDAQPALEEFEERPQAAFLETGSSQETTFEEEPLLPETEVPLLPDAAMPAEEMPESDEAIFTIEDAPDTDTE